MKLKFIFEQIPRPVKACACALAVVILAVVYYIALGCPTFTFEQEFRRAEKVHLVGPSKIVDRMSVAEYGEFETMLVGETDYGITFFGRYRTTRSGGKFSGKRMYRFCYQKKTGDVSFAAPPNVFGINGGIYALPVYVFTEHEDAVRATIHITAEGTRTYTLDNQKVTDPFHVTLESETKRNENGFFCFNLTAEATHDPFVDPFGKSNDQAYALFCLSNLCNEITNYDSQATMTILITVTLYDADGKLICTETVYPGLNQK